MPRMRQCLTFGEAVEMLFEAKVIQDRRYSVGSNGNSTTIEIPVGGIDAKKDGFFRRSEVCRLIGAARMLSEG